MTNKTILIIDDEPKFRANLADWLEDMGYETLQAEGGEAGLELFRQKQPDMVLADLNMPGLDGFGVVEELTRTSPETPILVISGVGVLEEAIRAIRLGAWDFLTKPLKDLELLEHTLGRAFERSMLLGIDRLYREHLEEEVAKRTDKLRQLNDALHALNTEISDTQRELLYTLGDVVETRSHETANHVRRVAKLSHFLAERVGLEPEEAKLLQLASPMHDVGKIGIPDSILNKPSTLTPEECEIIKSHTVIGHEILKHSERPLMKTAAIVARQHHEFWNGAGYPDGLSHGDIHIYGRITSVADVFDALTHPRVYRKAWGHERAVEYLQNQAGKMFDPELIRIFFADLRQVEALMASLG
ncbi:MAG: response regulator [Desulfovibrionaceae bacterium]|nr:response regulator [Desulfovibrionaceae bacterium]MBF0513471.1 response regulator [Desulfovibrionaceae bacterium]